MWIASSTSPPGGAGPSATSCGSIPRAFASAGASNNASRISNRRSMIVALVRCRSLVEVGPKPALGAFDRNIAPRRIVFELIAADPGHSEILAVAVAEIESGHGRSREHREILGQRHSARPLAKHIEQDRLEAVVGARGVARRGPDPLIFFADQLLVRKVLLRITPEAIANLRVKHLGEALGQPVGKRL